MTNIKVQFLLIICCLLLSTLCFAASLKESLDMEVQALKNANKITATHKIIISNIVNYHSKIRDLFGARIETELYFAFGRQYPEVQLIDAKENLVGVSLHQTVFIKGNYEQIGERTILRLKGFKGMMDGNILFQSKIDFNTGNLREKNLVAVLDIEAKILNEEQRKILSDVFRSALREEEKFNMASSADVDKMNPDDIQKVTGCSRDTCATIIGEQLGVDRVISSSIRKMADDYYFISGKLIDIKEMSIIVSKIVKHRGRLMDLDHALEKLAKELTANLEESMKADHEIEESAIEEGREESLEKADWGWHAAAISIALVSIYLSKMEAQKYRDLLDENESLKNKYNNSLSISERTIWQAEYDSNLDEMSTHKTNIQIYDTVTILALVWEVYLLWPSSTEEKVASTFDPFQEWIPHPVILKNRGFVTYGIYWQTTF